MRQAPVLLAVTLLALSACSARGVDPASVAAAEMAALARKACAPLAAKPFYRVFRGIRRADVPPAAFIKDLGDRFIPAAPKTHGGKGLLAYVPAIPPADAPADIPDELAIVVYESEATYKVRRATPEGVAYGDMHWEIFDKALSKSDGATPYSTNGKAIKANVPVDVMDGATDWQCGHTGFYIGRRLGAIAKDDFLPRLSDHVAHARASLGALGMDGYIVVATEQYEVAFTHWASEAAMNKAFASPAGKALAAEGGAMMSSVVWTSAVPFKGSILPGQALNVKFAR